MENINQSANQSVTYHSTQEISPDQEISNYKKGSFLDRLVAYLIDGIIITFICFLIGIVASLAKISALNLLNLFIGFIYGIFFIGISGATPGMKLLKLKVVNIKYQNIGFGTATGRALASILSGLALNLGYYWVLIDRKRQTWQDKLANTYVVKLDSNSNLISSTGDEEIATRQKILFGFLALILPMLGILAIATSVMLMAIDPAKQFSKANDAKRLSDLNVIENAISMYKLDHKNQLPSGITNVPVEISAEGVNICADLVPTYISSLPVDPKINDGLSISNCQTSYVTGYTISVDDQGRIIISAPQAEINIPTSVTK